LKQGRKECLESNKKTPLRKGKTRREELKKGNDPSLGLEVSLRKHGDAATTSKRSTVREENGGEILSKRMLSTGKGMEKGDIEKKRGVTLRVWASPDRTQRGGECSSDGKGRTRFQRTGKGGEQGVEQGVRKGKPHKYLQKGNETQKRKKGEKVNRKHQRPTKTKKREGGRIGKAA